uniref:Metallophos domain-containing protein n=1 Tax=Syphacia muris TaxID=451379 RepID=A0A0N5AN84_9BILA
MMSWNEFLSFEFSTLAWIARLREFEGHPIKILIVADPQLIGYRNELGPFKWIRQWDADRYLRNGFSRALRISDPDAIVFMGDLFDEGVQMSSNEYALTCQRFDNIFSFPEFIQRLYIPGDNDVGGEGVPVFPELVSRFQKHFITRFDLFKLGLSDFDIIHVNAFANSSDTVAKATGKLKIIVSHAPLLRIHGTMQKMLRQLNPSLVLSAHDHKAEIYREGRVSYNFYRASLYKHSKAVEAEISKTSPLIELQTPTCSYRMGVSDMGYGMNV